MTETVAHLSTLHVIAQIAITLIGFTGIVLALKGRYAGDWTASENLQIYGLISTSFVTLICCFVPELVGMLGIRGTLLWQISNGVLGITKLSALGVFYLIAVKSAASVAMSQKIVTSIALLLVAAHLLTAVDLIGRQEFFYIIGLVYPLIAATANFLLLLGLRLK